MTRSNQRRVFPAAFRAGAFRERWRGSSLRRPIHRSTMSCQVLPLILMELSPGDSASVVNGLAFWKHDHVARLRSRKRGSCLLFCAQAFVQVTGQVVLGPNQTQALVLPFLHMGRLAAHIEGRDRSPCAVLVGHVEGEVVTFKSPTPGIKTGGISIERDKVALWTMELAALSSGCFSVSQECGPIRAPC